MAQPILYGVFASPYVRKTRLVLTHKGINYQHEQTMPASEDAAFRGVSPLGKVPAWQDDKVAFNDSSIIVQYLERFYPGAKVIPEDASGFVGALWYDEYADSTLIAVLAGKLFREIVLAERLFQREPDKAAIEEALGTEIPAFCDFLESRIAGRDYLVGDALSLADLAIGGAFLLLYHCGHEVDQAKTPEFSAYLQRLYTAEPFASIIREDVAGLKQFGWDSPMGE